MRKKAAKAFRLDFAEIDGRHQQVFNTYEEGKLTLDDYLSEVVFYEPRPFTSEEFKTFMFAQSQPFPDVLDLQYGAALFGRPHPPPSPRRVGIGSGPSPRRRGRWEGSLAGRVFMLPAIVRRLQALQPQSRRDQQRGTGACDLSDPALQPGGIDRPVRRLVIRSPAQARSRHLSTRSGRCPVAGRTDHLH